LNDKCNGGATASRRPPARAAQAHAPIIDPLKIQKQLEPEKLFNNPECFPSYLVQSLLPATRDFATFPFWKTAAQLIAKFFAFVTVAQCKTPTVSGENQNKERRGATGFTTKFQVSMSCPELWQVPLLLNLFLNF
jgi:hypothetical protein